MLYNKILFFLEFIIFQNKLFELSQNSINTIMDKEQDITKKITNLSSNFKIKNTSFYLAAIIIDLLICN